MNGHFNNYKKAYVTTAARPGMGAGGGNGTDIMDASETGADVGCLPRTELYIEFGFWSKSCISGAASADHPRFTRHKGRNQRKKQTSLKLVGPTGHGGAFLFLCNLGEFLGALLALAVLLLLL